MGETRKRLCLSASVEDTLHSFYTFDAQLVGGRSPWPMGAGKMLRRRRLQDAARTTCIIAA